jgi:hypothetical protein
LTVRAAFRGFAGGQLRRFAREVMPAFADLATILAEE